jgi:hypothetical protein
LNLSCQPPGLPIAPPRIDANMTISRASSTTRCRHGWEVCPCCLDEPAGLDAEPRGRAGLLLGGAT